MDALLVVESVLATIDDFNVTTYNQSSPDMNQLQQISEISTIVADTGDLQAIRKYKPTDSTTNPSLVLKALKAMKEQKSNNYDLYLQRAINYANSKCNSKTAFSSITSNSTSAQRFKLNLAIDRIAVEFGLQILQIIPGYVSTELDARLSFDVKNSVKRAVRIIDMYEELGVENVRNRILIKVASTWEGFQIARILRQEHNIKCNMTLIFSVWQAAAAAQIAGAFLISPFVGRITDWHKAKYGADGGYDAYVDDPGVKSVREIYCYYRKIEAKTIIMGASFRNKHQILALVGCDRLTIAPKFLKELKESNDKITRYLGGNCNRNKNILQESKEDCDGRKDKLDVCEKNFRWGMCLDPCATEKLAEGVRRFAEDIVKLEVILREKFVACEKQF